MDLQSPNTLWVESLFDVSEPYLYVVVLPALVMFALGYLIFATLCGLVIFGDFPNASMLAGMGLIAGAGAFTAWHERLLNRAIPVPPVR